MDRQPPQPSLPRDDALAALVLSARSEPADIRAWRRSGELDRVRRGAYVPATASRGVALDRQDRALAHLEAVAAQLHTEFWFSHETAALVWGCDVVGLSGRTHITQRWLPNARGDANLVRHTLELPEADRTVHRGLPVTTLERTAVDCAVSMPGRNGLVVVDSALRLGADAEVLARLVDARAGRRGVRRGRLVVARADRRAESPGESLARWEILDAGLPSPEPQVEVWTPQGRYRLDIAWRAAKVALEFDGLVKYSGAFGDAGDVVFAEKRRQEALEAAGWLVVRITWDDLSNSHIWLARLNAALTRRTPAP